MRRFLLLSLLMAFSVIGFAQTRTVTGKVVDETGAGVPFASITVKGTNVGTSADANGNFSIVTRTGAVLEFTATGYKTLDVTVTSASTLNVVLTKGEGQTIDEVVVTAYGATRKRSFTGTASTINSESFKNLQVSSVTGVLQGQASGILAVSSNGQPGVNPTIRIRGIGSVNASADPLILVDGAPYGGNINSLNPNDIESITVLKDASSTSLYGSRAANGILQIVTKQGRGATKISLSGLTGFSSRAVKDYGYTSSQQIYELTWEALRNEARLTPSLVSGIGAASPEDYASKSLVDRLIYNPFGVTQPVGLDGKLVSNTKELWNENWTDQLLRRGIRNDFNVGISGGTDKTKYFISGQYLNDQGLVKESYFKRYGTRVKVDSKIREWLTAGINTNVSYSTQSYPAQGGSSYSNAIGWIRGASSLFPAYLVKPATGEFILDASGNKILDYGNNGTLRRPYGAGSNALGAIELNDTYYDRFITSSTGFAEAAIISGLKLRTQYTVDYYLYSGNEYFNPFLGDGAAYGGRSYKERDVTTSQTFTNTINYDKKLNEFNNINVVAGMESYKFLVQNVMAEKRGFTFPGVTELDYGSNPVTASSASYNNRMLSYFGRLNYDLYDRYHLSLSLRRDASTRFADSVRWGTFYSIGGAWNINRESFFKSNTFNDLKLRASYGTAGNQATSGYFPYLGLYSAGWDLADYAGSVISTVTNGNLTWEKQKILDVGLDFALLRNRISGSFTYFIRNSEDLLFSKPLPPSGGVNSVVANIGAVKNSGVEIDLTAKIIEKEDFSWSTSLNFSKIKNEIVTLPDSSISGSNFSNLIVGQSLYNFYIREYAGVDAADGRPMWYKDVKDAAGKVTERVPTKTWSEATRYYKGTSLPDWTAGISSNFRYKGLDLSFLIALNMGGKIYDGDYAGLMYGTVGLGSGSNWTTDILNRWQSPSNPGDGRTPKLTTTTDYQGTSSSTRFLFDGSYARIRNITMGYTLPKDFLNRAKLENIRFFVNLQNPVTFFGRKGLDPESGLAGVTSNTSALYKTISFGLNVDL